jgi:Protein of unknown function (DUF3551)
MRTTALVAAAIGAALVITTEPKAQYYPWCATYSLIGGENCGFVTFAQCRANVAGIGGFCYSNPWYHAHAAAARVDIRPYTRKKRDR